jgi:type VI secretion system protein ImpB
MGPSKDPHFGTLEPLESGCKRLARPRTGSVAIVGSVGARKWLRRRPSTSSRYPVVEGASTCRCNTFTRVATRFEEATVAIQDELPQSRITLKYRTTINGEEEDVKLPMRTMVLGDFSMGSSKDRQEELEERKLRTLDGTNRVDDLMKDMAIQLKVQVDNKINPDKEELDLSLPITGLKSFSPDEVAQNIPQVKALLLLKTLLSEMQSNIDNRRDLRKLVQEICANPDSMQKALGELKGYEQFKLPNRFVDDAADADRSRSNGSDGRKG